ncbi:MAG: nickel pincer cofactor biosynthesis protein LarC [Planctomycetota bacterium]|nr:nickel pincer cofactor biosynthesis protein LarC [Planctomycetota bacterium]
MLYCPPMMRFAFFQPFSGISGDMTLGALLDAGLPLGELETGLRSLAVEGFRLEVSQVQRGELRATRLRVVVEGPPAPREPGEQLPSDDHDHSHGHSHDHSHGHGHASGVSASGKTAGSCGPPRRNLRDILRLIDESRLPGAVQESATAVFRRLGEAEAHVHGVELQDVHFPEVGAVDSLVDIVGSCLALHLLDVDEVHSAPVHVGTGFVDGSHGRLPLPAPATLALLTGFPVRQVDSGAELTTPTGAALLTTLARSFGTMPDGRVTAVGFGAGDDRPGPVPNCLRVILGEGAGHGASDRVVLIETNVDDMSPEWSSHLMDKLFESGALDVFLTPILMKKSRPAHQVSVIARLSQEQSVTDTLFRESTTFGIRRSEVERSVLDREVRPVRTEWGDVRIKVGRRGGAVVTAAPEYEDLKRLAERANLPLKEAHEVVMRLYRSTESDPVGPHQDSSSA